MTTVTLTINGNQVSREVEPRLLLVHYIREELNLTGTHIGCDTTSCGACTVLVDGKAIKSCTIFAVQAAGRNLETIEGVAKDGLHPLQEGFWEKHGLQCGYCTPGMIMTAKAFLAENPDPTEDEIRWAISGNLCRCTGYIKIVRRFDTRRKSCGQHRGEGGVMTNCEVTTARPSKFAVWAIGMKRKEDPRFIQGAGPLCGRHQAARYALSGHRA